MVKKKIITMALCAAMAANVCMPVSAEELPADTEIVIETAADTTEETSKEAVVEGGDSRRDIQGGSHGRGDNRSSGNDNCGRSCDRRVRNGR